MGDMLLPCDLDGETRIPPHPSAQRRPPASAPFTSTLLPPLVLPSHPKLPAPLILLYGSWKVTLKEGTYHIWMLFEGE
ncbi:unnamed protein product [Victoria cruziana]